MAMMTTTAEAKRLEQAMHVAVATWIESLDAQQVMGHGRAWNINVADLR